MLGTMLQKSRNSQKVPIRLISGRRVICIYQGDWGRPKRAHTCGGPDEHGLCGPHCLLQCGLAAWLLVLPPAGHVGCGARLHVVAHSGQKGAAAVTPLVAPAPGAEPADKQNRFQIDIWGDGLALSG